MFPFRSVAVTRHGQRRRRCRWATRYGTVRKRSLGKNGANGLRSCTPNCGGKNWRRSPLASLVQPTEKPCRHSLFPTFPVARAVFSVGVSGACGTGQVEDAEEGGASGGSGDLSALATAFSTTSQGRCRGTAKKDRDGAEPSRRTESEVTRLPVLRLRQVSWRRWWQPAEPG